MSKPEHILVIRLSAMGDVAMTVPVLRALLDQNPDLKLTILTKSFFAPIFKDLPGVTVFHADIKGTHKGIPGLWKLSKALKTVGFDAIADLHNVLRSKILRTFLPNVPTAIIDKGRSQKKALIKGSIFEALKSTHERYADVFRILGLHIDLSNPKFPKEKPELLNIELNAVDKKRPWIGIAPFAAYQGKTYPSEFMAKVIQKLSKSHEVLLFGAGNSEAQQLDLMAKSNDHVTNTAGQYSFEEELDIISNLDIMLSMDSGNAHLAAMYGIKVVTIWGVTHPFTGFLPFNHSMDSAILADRNQYPKIPTSVYGKTMPKGYENAMKTITPEHVVEKVLSYL